jgi:hypothetical protein
VVSPIGTKIKPSTKKEVITYKNKKQYQHLKKKKKDSHTHTHTYLVVVDNWDSHRMAWGLAYMLGDSAV